MVLCWDNDTLAGCGGRRVTMTVTVVSPPGDPVMENHWTMRIC